jgi:hypothetical protein
MRKKCSSFLRRLTGKIYALELLSFSFSCYLPFANHDYLPKYRPDSQTDPRTDRLITFEGESSFGFAWIFVCAFVYLMYTVIRKTNTSPMVLRAKQMVARKKSRSN